MESKTHILIATFVSRDRLSWFINYLYEKFKIKKETIFIYEVEQNECDYLLTFKLKNDKRIDFKFHFANATVVNFKDGCLFSINGMKRLVEKELRAEIGNVDYGSHKIKWCKYENTLVLSNKNSLSLKKIKKIELKQEKNCF